MISADAASAAERAIRRSFAASDGARAIGDTKHSRYSRDEDTTFFDQALAWLMNFAGSARIFDIVNGFLIDAVAHCVWSTWPSVMRHLQMLIWLRLSSAPISIFLGKCAR